MRKDRIQSYTAFGISLVLSLAILWFAGCGGSSTPTTATNGTVNVSMTDPATCSLEFKNIYVTVTKVTANINADAGPNGSGWQTILDLSKSPVQIDLLSLNPTNTCLLKQLGSDTSLPAGKYQQIRLYLQANNVPTNSSDACGSNGWNCVVTQSGTTTELQLPSEVQTGIKIPSPNITSGGLTVTAGQSVDLNIDFQSCASIVHEGNGAYRLKPVLFAGEVSQNMNSISGQVVAGNSSGSVLLGSSGQPTPVAGATVLFEQPDSNGVEVVKDSTTTDSNGNFFVCPLPGGNYDIAVTAQTSGTLGATTTYNPTVAFSVPVGTKLSQIPLVPEASSVQSTGGAATVEGQVDTSPNTSDGESVMLTPTMSITPMGGSATSVVIPVFTVNGTALLASGQPPSVQTTSSPSPSTPACSTGSDCYNFSLTVPASNPNVGTFSSGAITYGVQSSSSVTYSLTASAPSCTTTGTATASSLAVTPDNTTKLSSDLSLSGCS